MGRTFSDFLSFLQVSYFRIVFILIILVPVYISFVAMTQIVLSDALKEYFFDFLDDDSYAPIHLLPRLSFSIFADIALILAGTLLLQLMRSFANFNTDQITTTLKEQQGARAARMGNSLFRIFTGLALLFLVILVLLPHVAFTLTLIARGVSPDMTIYGLLDGSALEVIGRFSQSVPRLLDSDVATFSLAVNISAILLQSALIAAVLFGFGKSLENRTLWFVVGIWCIALILHVSIFFYPVEASNFFGPFGIVMMFFAFVTSVLAAFLYRRALLPLFLLACGLVLSAFVFDYSQTRTITSPLDGPETIEANLKEEDYTGPFLCRVAEGPRFDGKIPIFIIAAEGGGMYAAYFAATVMEQLSQAYPKLTQNVFAMSGVSGGSLGLSLFAEAMVAIDSEKREHVIERFFRSDFLTPTFAALAFVDVPQLLSADRHSRHRAYAIERSFELAWDRALNSVSSTGKDNQNRFEMDASNLSEREIAVFNNAVVINNGLPLLIGPFDVLPKIDTKKRQIRNGPINSYANFSELFAGTTIRLSTAVSLGARFPYITPTGKLKTKKDGHWASIADGGYFDNTGMATAILLTKHFQHKLKKLSDRGAPCTSEESTYQFYLIRIGGATKLDLSPLLSTAPSELSAPIYGLYNTRPLLRKQLSELSRHYNLSIIDIPLFDDEYDLTLSWYLSQKTKKIISNRAKSEIADLGKENSFGGLLKTFMRQRP